MGRDLTRLGRSGNRVTGAGAIALLVLLFAVKWYGVRSIASVRGVSFSASANGWNTFTNSRWLWLITVIVALAVVSMGNEQRDWQLPVRPAELIAGLGALSMIFILYRIINHPTAGASVTVAGVHYTASAGTKVGIWLALVAACAITYGGYLAMGEEDGPASGRSARSDMAPGAFSGLVGSSAPPAQPTPPSDEPPAGAA